MKSCVHYVGFRTDSEYWSAVRIWGKPDFFHPCHDYRMYGEIAENDIVIFGSAGHINSISAY